MTDEEALLRTAVAKKIGLPIATVENYGYPGQAELALIDAVLSIRANYGGPSSGVRGAVGRYREFSSARTELDDLQVLGAIDPSELQRVLANRQKSSGKPKADLIVEVADRLVGAGVVKAADVVPNDPGQRRAWCGVHGLGDVTWAYFGMLLGRPGVKADTMIRRFVRSAVDREVSAPEATRLVASVASSLQVDVSQLDHAMWRHQRAQGRRSTKRE